MTAFPSTISYFTYVLGIISDLQAGEIMYTNNKITDYGILPVDENHIFK